MRCHQRLLRIEDSAVLPLRLAQGAIGRVECEFVKIGRDQWSTKFTGNGPGIDLSGVNLAEVNFSRFGFTNGNRPAVNAVVGRRVNIKGITSAAA